MSLYINRVRLEFNGQSFEDFDNFTDNSVVRAKQVPLMNKTGHALMQPRYGFTVSYKIPIVPLPFDITAVEGGTMTVEFEGGGRTTYSQVYTLESGDASIDGETEMTRTVSFSAEDRVEE